MIFAMKLKYYFYRIKTDASIRFKSDERKFISRSISTYVFFFMGMWKIVLKFFGTALYLNWNGKQSLYNINDYKNAFHGRQLSVLRHIDLKRNDQVYLHNDYPNSIYVTTSYKMYLMGVTVIWNYIKLIYNVFVKQIFCGCLLLIWLP